MPYYLEFDGIDDGFIAPSMSFDTIEVDLLVEKRKVDETYVVCPPNLAVAMSRGADLIYGATAHINGVQVNSLPSNQRFQLILKTTNIMSGSIYFMSVQGNNATKGKIWSIKLLNGMTVQAHYDFTLGNVQDKSGNNRHGSNNGGIFILESGGVVNAPIPNILHINSPTSDNTISDEPNMDKAVVTFTFDQDVTEWTVNVLGSDHTTGAVADSGNAVAVGTEITAVIDWTELYQEGQNRINIYGRNTDGQWTPYED